MTNTKIHKLNSAIIALNKKVHYNYFITNNVEAGLVLLGWEVKALRLGQANINNSYISLKNSAAYLIGAAIIPSNTTSSCNLVRARKLLLKQRELDSLLGKINYEGYTAVALSLYWKNTWCKVKIGIARGKKKYDKRSEIKKREWSLNKIKIMKKRQLLHI